MNRFNTYVLVAAMAVSGVGYATAAEPNINGGDNTANIDARAGQLADASTQREIRSTLAKVVNDAVSTNHFDNLNGYLAKADKDRLVDMKKASVDDLNNAINQFRADFKSKYNQDFDIQGDHFNDAMIMAGQDKKSATVSIANADLSNAAGNLNSTNTTITQTNTPANTPPQPGMTNGAPADRVLNTPPGTVTSSNRDGHQSGAADDGSTSGKATGPASSGSNANSTVHGNDTNANPGLKPADNMATNTTVTNTNTNLNNGIAAAGVTLNLINEGHIMNAWRLDVPDQISAEQLKQNLVKHIRMLDDQKATWPADVNAAYRATAYHVLQSFSDSSLASER